MIGFLLLIINKVAEGINVLLYSDIEEAKIRRVIYTLIFAAGKILVIGLIVEATINRHSAGEWISGTFHEATDTYCLQCLDKSWVYIIPVGIITVFFDHLIYKNAFHVLFSLVIIFLIWKLLTRSYPHYVIDVEFVKDNIFYIIGLLAAIIFRIAVKIDRR
jgi:hypothetical protein